MKYIGIIVAICILPFSTLADWQLMTSPVTANLRSISYIDPETIFVAGSGGTILKYDGNEWLPIESNTDKNLNAISMVSDMDGWAGGVDNILLQCSDGEWSVFPPIDSNIRTFNAILALAVDDVFFLSYDLLNGTFLHHWDGNNMTAKHTFSDNMTILVGDKADNLWVAGATSQVFHFNGTSWDHSLSQTLPENIKIFDLTLNDAGYPIVTGVRLPGWDLDLVYEYSPDTGWVEHWRGYEKRVMCAAVNKTRGFAMGANGRVIEYSIFGWNELTSLPTRQINDVVLPSIAEGYAVADLGAILHFQQPSIRVDLNTKNLKGSELFDFGITLLNPGQSVNSVMEIVMLEAYGFFFFWPTWTEEFDSKILNLPENLDETETIFSFTWPEGAGSGQAAFWGALLGTDNTIFGYDIEAFGWSD